MPFRRKHRNPLFGTSCSADKENAGNDGPQLQDVSLLPPVPPRLFRCHSDTTQRTCCDINPNTVTTLTSQNVHHRHGVLSTKEKISNLQQLNSTLIKEVSSLRSSNHAMAEQLRTVSFMENALLREKEQLKNEISHLETTQTETVEKLEGERKYVEDRLLNMGFEVDKLQNMNGVLAEEAARLREDADRHAAEKHAMLAELENVLGEKTILEELVDSIRASGEALREEMWQALLQSETEKDVLCAEKETLLQEKMELQSGNEKVTEELRKVGSEKVALLVEKEKFMTDKEKIEAEVSSIAARNEELVEQLAAKKQALVLAQENLVTEKVRMLHEKTKLECFIHTLRQDHEEAMKNHDAQRRAAENVLKSEVEQLRIQNRKFAEERDSLREGINGYEEELRSLHSQVTVHQEEEDNLQHELRVMKDAAMDARKEYKASLAAAEKEKNDVVFKFKTEIEEALSQVKVKDEEMTKLKRMCDKSSQQITLLQVKLTAEEGKQKSMETQMQTMKGDLLVAEDAALEAEKKAKEVEKEAGIAIERQTRETSQKIGALESKLAAMVERQTDLESEIEVKERESKAAIQGEREAKAKLKSVQEESKIIECEFEHLKSSILLGIQSIAMKGTQSITTLQAKFSSLMEIKETTNYKSRRRSKSSKARVIYQPKGLVCIGA